MLRGAIVGFGNVAQFGHWPAYAASDEVEIIAVIDASAERRAQATKLKHSLGTFASLSQLHYGAIDFVDICTPPARHAEPMLTAIERGWHVLCEKPFLLDSAVLQEVRARARERRLAVLPVHNWKYAPIIRDATRLLQSGAIGTLRRVEITTLRMHDAAAADPSQLNWRRDRSVAGGGILMDHGWHSLYLALDWFREQPSEVKAKLHWSDENAVEDEAQVELQFPSGAAQIALSWTAAERKNHIRLIGTGGEIVLADDTLLTNGRTQGYDAALSAGSHHADWFAAMLPDVVTALREPELSRAAFEEAALCLTTIERCYAVACASSGTSVSSRMESASSRSARV